MQLVASLVALLACARVSETQGSNTNAFADNIRNNKALGERDSYNGCSYEGRWFREGAAVSAREWCLRCVCARGALSCRRRACAPLPDPPPHRCHVLHRKNSCCPELHCPDGITMTEQGASARFDTEDYSEIATPASVSHACVEGGTVYSAGSAMSSSTACEQCFCLGGARRCVRPKCLPSPPGCIPRPAPGACCPQRYYCEHDSTSSPNKNHLHDCHIEHKWVGEGERVTALESGKNCTQCFCLRGVVQCSALACAPPLLGCTPVLRPGQCCPHQYRCTHGTKPLQRPYISDNLLISARNNVRSFASHSYIKQETTTKAVLGSATKKSSPATPAHIELFTTKVKRKTNEAPPSFSKRPVQNITSSSTATETMPTSTEIDLQEGSVKVIINGTINCTAEISSTSFPLNFSVNDTKKIEMEAMPRLPNTEQIEAYTFNPNDIITNGDFEENDTFTINVTSSLTTNSSKSTPKPELTATEVKTSIALPIAVNITKKTKGDYDYDYTEPTLPPSLPNLKIIPFVAADAVVEDSPVKVTPTFPILEREDKYPVYYPSKGKETPFATRREDVYPVFTLKKDTSKYPGVDLISSLLHDFKVSTGIGKGHKENTKTTSASSTFYVETPSVNLFSPPVETEGGFVPKGPSVEEEYYAIFPSTSSKTPVPHITTSMQLDNKGECVTADGRRVPEGDSVSMTCSVCTCAWQELHCSPRPCHTPPQCSRRSVTTSSADLCCGDLICDQDISSTTTLAPVTTKHEIVSNVTEETVKKQSETESSLDNNVNKNNTVEPTTDHQTSPVTNSTSTTSVVAATTEAAYNKEDFSTSYTTLTLNTSTTVLTPETSDIKNNNGSQQFVEYEEEDEEEEEEEEDGGFSFGNVLKLLLSDNYETTTTTPKRLTVSSSLPKTSTARPILTTKVFVKPSIASFVPMPPYTPPKKTFTPNVVNRIDHLVLGEATAIKKTTTYSKPTTQKPLPTRSTTKKANTPSQLVPISEAIPARPTSTGLPGIGSGLLKLAGCNIYGRMYRVGRIIAELSTPCQECRCTELGVQCTSLNC